MQTDRIAPVEESKALISPKPPTLKRKTEEKTSEIPLPTETQVEQHPIGQDSQDKNQSTAAALLAKKKARK